MIAGRLSRRELSSAVRNYWFVVNGGIFLVGGLLLLLFGQQDVSVLGYRGVARSLTGLLQLALFVVPLMALFPAAAAIAGEREVGTLDYLLAQPVTRSQVYVGKWCGIAAAVGLSILGGFAAIGAVALSRGVPPGLLLALVGLTLLLAAAFVSFGLWLSAASGTQGRATSLGLTVWIATLALGSLGMMGAFVGWGLPPTALEVWALINPAEAFRMALVALVDPGLAMLGPVGEDLADRFGDGGLVALAVLSLAGWTAIAFWAGRRTFDAPVAGRDARPAGDEMVTTRT